MKLLILGFYGHFNIGDESYRLSFPIVFPEHELTFVDKINPTDVAKYDAVILGGGNVLKPYFFKELEKATKVDKPIFAISVGVEEGMIVPNVFRHIYVRDLSSKEQLVKQGHKVSFMPDLAFLLKADAQKGREWLISKFATEGLDLYQKKVAIIINSYLLHAGQDGLARDVARFNNFAYELARVIDDTSASFIFIPFGQQFPIDDRIANSWVAAKCKFWTKNLVIFDKLDVQNTIDVLAAVDVIISTRLHSIIFSYSFGIPFIDITHHSKSINFLKTIPNGTDAISYWSFDVKKLQDMLKQKLH